MRFENNVWTGIAMVGVLAATAVLASCRNKQDTRQQAIAVAVAAVQTGTIEQTIRLTGELDTQTYVQVSPKISGRLMRLALDDGTTVAENTAVKKGQVMAVLEHSELEARFKQAQAAVKAAEAALTQQQADIEDKRRDKERMENLFRAGSATEKQKDTAITLFQMGEAATRSRQAGLDEAKAACRQAKAAMNEAFIRSPITGIVGKKFADEGNMLNPGSPIATVLPMERLKFLIDIPQQYLSEAGGAKIELSVDAWPGKSFAAKIEKIYPQVNPQTRTFTMELSTANERRDDGSYRLLPGMYATADISLSRRENVIVVPADSLIRLSGRYYAFIVENGRAGRREVSVGFWSGNAMEITDGLKAGQQLVVNGQNKLTDNTPVEIIGQHSQGENIAK